MTVKTPRKSVLIKNIWINKNNDESDFSNEYYEDLSIIFFFTNR